MPVAADALDDVPQAAADDEAAGDGGEHGLRSRYTYTSTTRIATPFAARITGSRPPSSPKATPLFALRWSERKGKIWRTSPSTRRCSTRYVVHRARAAQMAADNHEQ